MNKINRLILNIAVLAGAIGGAMIISANVGLNYIGYIFFLANCFASIILLLHTKDYPKAILSQNIFFIVLNIIGFFRYLP